MCVLVSCKDDYFWCSVWMVCVEGGGEGGGGEGGNVCWRGGKAECVVAGGGRWVQVTPFFSSYFFKLGQIKVTLRKPPSRVAPNITQWGVKGG